MDSGSDSDDYDNIPRTKTKELVDQGSSIGQPPDEEENNDKPEELAKNPSIIDNAISRVKNTAKKRSGFQGNIDITGKTENEIKLIQEYTELKRQSQRQLALMKGLDNENKKLKEELRETLADLGELTVERTAKSREKRKSERFQQIFRTCQLASTSRVESTDESSTRQRCEVLSIQQHDSNGREDISLPTTTRATTLHNNYKLLLLSVAQRLLSSDVVKLKDWANQNFSTENPENATDVLLQLDQKGVTNASDLSQLRDFFESILRIDLVYIIDKFLDGDYSILPYSPASNRRKWKANDLTSESRENRNPATSRKEGNNEPQSIVLLQTPIPFPISPNESPPTAQYEAKIFKPSFSEFTSTRMATLADGPLTSEIRTKSDKSSKETNPLMTNQTGNTQTFRDAGSNGFKLSKFLRPDAEDISSCNSQSSSAFLNQDSDDDQDGNWLCNHYKRRCYVKFECCGKFWPCHRCHNNQSACYQKKLKARDAEMVKCVKCRKVQQFGQFCCDCGANFADYYCGLCKHLTGKDEDLYHCEKCGTCRIHKERSFHCDTCGVCLDNQLIGNHYCRGGSAHDKCCICLEDAFTGCEILPCSHKVHKECATQMIRNGITRCPICRKSFVSKLERRPTWNSRRRNSGN